LDYCCRIPNPAMYDSRMDGLANKRILVVDDNPDLLEMYHELLTILGVRAEVASDGKIAWEILQSGTFDAVFSDIKMPVMDGVELLKKIRARDRTSPCVLITSGFSDYPADLLFQLGANGFLPKPANSAAIKDALLRACRPLEERWKSSGKTFASEKIVKNFKTFEDLIDSRELNFGHGGFCVGQSAPTASIHSLVEFSFSFESDAIFERIDGVGTVQWVHTVDSAERKKGLGVEITELSDGCRKKFCDWIHSQNFESFIPLA
jgi:CheY-like chemotaxis protein